jgi:hypothetical protein
MGEEKMKRTVRLVRFILFCALVVMLGYMGYFITNSWEWWVIACLVSAIAINEQYG